MKTIKSTLILSLTLVSYLLTNTGATAENIYHCRGSNGRFVSCGGGGGSGDKLSDYNNVVDWFLGRHKKPQVPNECIVSDAYLIGLNSAIKQYKEFQVRLKDLDDKIKEQESRQVIDSPLQFFTGKSKPVEVDYKSIDLYQSKEWKWLVNLVEQFDAPCLPTTLKRYREYHGNDNNEIIGALLDIGNWTHVK